MKHFDVIFELMFLFAGVWTHYFRWTWTCEFSIIFRHARKNYCYIFIVQDFQCHWCVTLPRCSHSPGTSFWLVPMMSEGVVWSSLCSIMLWLYVEDLFASQKGVLTNMNEWFWGDQWRVWERLHCVQESNLLRSNFYVYLSEFLVQFQSGRL